MKALPLFANDGWFVEFDVQVQRCAVTGSDIMRPNISWKFLAAALATSLFFFAHPGESSAASPWRTDFHQAEAEARRDGKLLLLHFHASWCGPCRRMNSEVLSSAQLARLLGTNVIAVKVDSDRSPGIVSRFGIHALPSDLFVQPDGKILGRTSGYQAPSTYLQTVSSLSSRFTRTRYAMIAQKTQKPPASQSPGLREERRPPNEQRVALHRGAKQERENLESGPALGLAGYCPVTLWKSRKWKAGREDYSVQYEGQTFRMAGPKQRDQFREDPRRFAPRLLGCDPVILSEQEIATEGSTSWGAFYDGELYLFQSLQTRRRFKRNPERYSQTRHVLREEIRHRRL